MKKFLQILFWVLFSFVIVGFIGLFTAVICDKVAQQHGSILKDPASGHVVPFDISLYRGGPLATLYVTRTYHLTSVISGYVAAVGLGFPAIVVLTAMTGNLIRLLLPSSLVSANFELARYRDTVGENGVTEEGLRYVAAWRDLKRRTLSFFCVFVGGMVVPLCTMFTLSALSLGPLPLPGSATTLLAILCVWAFGGLALMIYARAFRCPRCHDYFSRRSGRGPLKFCTQCGLPKNSPPTAEVSPDFVQWKEASGF